MADTYQRYGAGVGLALGAGIGGTAATLSGLGGDLALLTGFGVAGGLVVGGAVGRYADENRERDDRRQRLVAVAVLFSLLVGGLLGALAAWMSGSALPEGYAVGSAAGGLFGLLLSGVLLAAARTDDTDETVTGRRSEQ